MKSVPVLTLVGLSMLVQVGCDGSSSAAGANNLRLLRVEAAPLADVYGLDAASSETSERIVLFRRDVLLGPNVQDEIGRKSARGTYHMLGPDPDTMQPRVLIRRRIGSDAFDDAVARFDEWVQLVTPARRDQQVVFSNIARNVAFRLTFDQPLGLPDDFFATRDENGHVVGIHNTNAVQLLELEPSGSRVIPTRIVQRGNEILLDPVLLAREGVRLALPNNAVGLPESRDFTTANVRIALALEGPQRIPGLVPESLLRGGNVYGRTSIVRDFRSGNSKDNDYWLAKGFARDAIRPRLIGQLVTRLESAVAGSGRHTISVFKDGSAHELDTGDVLRLLDGGTGEVVATALIVRDPEADRGDPGVAHVTVEVDDASRFAAASPRDVPSDPKQRDAWLSENAPRVVVEVPFEANKSDELRNFVRFSPVPAPATDAQRAADPTAIHNVSPFASVIVQFSKPIDLVTASPYESIILSSLGDTSKVLDPKLGTPHLITTERFDENGSATTLLLRPPLGFHLDDALRRDNRPYYLHLVAGVDGLRDHAGNSVDLGFENNATEHVRIPFYLDVGGPKSAPRFPNNPVVSIVRRFLDPDEDESVVGVADSFGSASYVDGALLARPTARSSSYIDSTNQVPSPPNPPLSFCPAGQSVLLTAATPFTQPIVNPLNPWGCRLQTVWREIDASLSRTDPFDFNLDIERIWYAPFQGTAAARQQPVTFDIHDSLTLELGHSERRPSNCLGPASLPNYTQSGLRLQFFHNYLRDLQQGATSWSDRNQIASRPGEHTALRDRTLYIRPTDVTFDPTRSARFIPLPEFEKPYFTWRDERLLELGGGQGNPRILSPFKQGFWDGFGSRPAEDGRVGAIALPLLADFQILPDDPARPSENPWFAIGINGLQMSLAVTTSLTPRQTQPFFRAYSAGGLVLGQDTKYMRPTLPGWQVAEGGWNYTTAQRTAPADANTYWARIDYLKRVSVQTFGFIDLADPHRAALSFYGDSRLGPYDTTDTKPSFVVVTEADPGDVPGDSRARVEFRGAGGALSTFEAFDPRVAGDAHVRFADPLGRWSGYQHTRWLTGYEQNPNRLFDDAYLSARGMDLADVEYLGFRVVFENDVAADPPAVPRIRSLGIAYRLHRIR